MRIRNAGGDEVRLHILATLGYGAGALGRLRAPKCPKEEKREEGAAPGFCSGAGVPQGARARGRHSLYRSYALGRFSVPSAVWYGISSSRKSRKKPHRYGAFSFSLDRYVIFRVSLNCHTRLSLGSRGFLQPLTFSPSNSRKSKIVQSVKIELRTIFSLLR